MVYTIVVADDITGANDIGIMYAKCGLDTVVYSFDQLKEDFTPNHEVTIIDTNSRFCTREEAYQRVYEICKRVGREGAEQFINKQCSVFRGNIGAEFDAMLDALGEEHGMVVLAFPDNGRTTIHAIHYVNGVKLEDSQFRKDPVHPMQESSLVMILSKQTERKVVSIPVEVLDEGKEALLCRIREEKKNASYLIFDARDNKDLELLAEVLADEPVICGSSALGYYFAKKYAKKHNYSAPIAGSAKERAKILSIAGSLTPQTKAQCAYLAEHGYAVLELDTTKLFEEAERQKEEERILKEAVRCLREKDFVMLRSMQAEEDVTKTKMCAAEHGIDNITVSEIVSGELAYLAKALGTEFAIVRYIVCGGDTSASFCKEFSITGMKVLEEIEAGLPTCQSIDAPYYKLVLKSGSFGKPDFVEKAIRFLA